MKWQAMRKNDGISQIIVPKFIARFDIVLREKCNTFLDHAFNAWA